MEKRKYLAGAFVAGMMMVASAVSVFAATDEGAAIGADDDRALRHEEIIEAILNEDYEAWSALMSEMPEVPGKGNAPQVLEVINEDNFAQFSEAHQLMEESREIMEELGVERGFGGGFGGGFEGKRGGNSKFGNGTCLRGQDPVIEE